MKMQLSQILRVVISASWCLASLIVASVALCAGGWWNALALLMAISAITAGWILKEEWKYL